jgi:D-lactate dehydrogenase (cytochrome)
MRYGSIRDLVLAMTVILGDGRIIRAGRPVVKNVAGYDLPKVLIGSHGTLGLIADVTLKLAPRPRARRTLLVPVDDLAHGLECAERLLPHALLASAIVLARAGGAELGIEGWTSPYVIAYTAEGMPGDVAEELKRAGSALQAVHAAQAAPVEFLTGTDVWAAALKNATADSMILRAGVTSENLAAFLQRHAATFASGKFVVDVASGLVYVNVMPENAASASALVSTLRQAALHAGGYAVLMHVPEEWRDSLERWGYQPDTLELMARLKERWDPGGILNPGHFIL